MAFDDDPIIDKNAEQSQESVLKTILVFSKRNGFICHQIDGTDDYGVDIICQLTIQGKATGYNFPIQVKSKVSYDEVKRENEVYKSFSFFTSRLGYLVRHKPITGLIIIYDDTSGLLYYEFAFELYNRIREQKSAESWKAQDSIQLHIPLKNILNERSIKELHQKISLHSQNFSSLYNDQATAYGLPSALSEEKPNDKSPKEFLFEHGITLFNGNRYQTLAKLLKSVEYGSLREPLISYLGAITFTELGDLLEADFFFKLACKTEDRLNSQQRETLSLHRFQWEYFIGKLSREELRSLLENIQNSGDQNSIVKRLNLLNLDLIDFVPCEGYDEGFILSILKLFDEIESSSFSGNAKVYYLIVIADILNRAVNGILTDMFLGTKIIQGIGGNPATPERLTKSKRVRELFVKSVKCLIDCLQKANDQDDELLKAHAQYYMALANFSHFNSYHQSDNKWPENQPNEFIEETFRNALGSYNIYNKLGLKPSTYKSITLAVEIYLISQKWANYSLEHIAQKKKIERAKAKFDNAEFKTFDGSQVKKTDEFIKSVKRTFNK